MNNGETSRAEAQSAFLLHLDYVRKVAIRCAPLPGVYDDVVHEVYIAFVSKAGLWDLDDTNGVRALLKVMTEQAAHRLWHEYSKLLPGKLRQVAEFVRSRHEENENELSYRDEYESMMTCMQRLPRDQRDLLRQYYFEHETTNALARELGATEDAVRRRLSRARENLRRLIRTTTREDADAPSLRACSPEACDNPRPGESC